MLCWEPWATCRKPQIIHSFWRRWVVCVCVQLLSGIRLFATPWTVAHQAPLSMEFSWQEYSSGLPFPSPGDLPDSGIKPTSPAWADRCLPLSCTWGEIWAHDQFKMAPYTTLGAWSLPWLWQRNIQQFKQKEFYGQIYILEKLAQCNG